MSSGSQTMRIELARELQRFGEERGGQVACLVVLLAEEFEFVWPSDLDEQQITNCERAIVGALTNRWADSA